mmetsp:Transcript_24313/g.23930  ORF Transcript_24313/g.23930 Transcript_24313/m.23930 type:complete len:95 (+) Transcript_24313:173-457(+)
MAQTKKQTLEQQEIKESVQKIQEKLDNMLKSKADMYNMTGNQTVVSNAFQRRVLECSPKIVQGHTSTYEKRKLDIDVKMKKRFLCCRKKQKDFD